MFNKTLTEIELKDLQGGWKGKNLYTDSTLSLDINGVTGKFSFKDHNKKENDREGYMTLEYNEDEKGIDIVINETARFIILMSLGEKSMGLRVHKQPCTFEKVIDIPFLT